MADLLSFNQPLIVLERRKKKDEEEEEEESPRSLLFFPALEPWKEAKERCTPLLLFPLLMAAEPRKGEGWPRLEEEKSFI